MTQLFRSLKGCQCLPKIELVGVYWGPARSTWIQFRGVELEFGCPRGVTSRSALDALFGAEVPRVPTRVTPDLNENLEKNNFLPTQAIVHKSLKHPLVAEDHLAHSHSSPLSHIKQYHIFQHRSSSEPRLNTLPSRRLLVAFISTYLSESQTAI